MTLGKLLFFSQIYYLSVLVLWRHLKTRRTVLWPHLIRELECLAASIQYSQGLPCSLVLAAGHTCSLIRAFAHEQCRGMNYCVMEDQMDVRADATIGQME